METSQINGKHSTHPSTLTPAQSDLILKLEPIVNAALKAVPVLLDTLDTYAFSALFTPDAHEDPVNRICCHALFHLKAMSTVNNNDAKWHIRVIQESWITFLQYKITEDRPDKEKDLLTALESIKSRLSPTPTTSCNIAIKAQARRRFKPDQQLRELAKQCQQTPSICNIYLLWERLQTSLRQRNSFKIKFNQPAKLHPSQNNFDFLVLYEILYFRREMMAQEHIPIYKQQYAAAADHLIKCFFCLVNALTDDNLNQFIKAWWYFAILESGYPPLIQSIFKNHPQLDLKIRPMSSTDNSDTIIAELRLLSFELDNFLRKHFRYSIPGEQLSNLQAHTRCITSFFLLSFKIIKLHYPEIDFTAISTSHWLVLSYFFSSATPKSINLEEELAPLTKVPSTQISQFSYALETCLLQLRILKSEKKVEIVKKSILKFLLVYLEMFTKLDNLKGKEALNTIQQKIFNILTTSDTDAIQSLLPHRDDLLSNALQRMFDLVPITSKEDPPLEILLGSFGRDLQSFLKGKSPYSVLDSSIRTKATKLALGILSQPTQDIKRENLRQLALLWVEATLSCVLQLMHAANTYACYKSIANLHLQKRMCLPKVTPENLISALIESCPNILLFTTDSATNKTTRSSDSATNKTTRSSHCIPEDTPFLHIINQALLQLFHNCPISNRDPLVASHIRQFPYDFVQATQTYKEILIPLISRLQETLVTLKYKEASLQELHTIYKILSEINQNWLLKIIDCVKNLPADQTELKSFLTNVTTQDPVNPDTFFKERQEALDQLQAHLDRCQKKRSNITLPLTNFSDIEILWKFAKRSQEDGPLKYANFLIPKLGIFCLSRINQTYLVSFTTESQEKYTACSTFDPKIIEAAYAAQNPSLRRLQSHVIADHVRTHQKQFNQDEQAAVMADFVIQTRIENHHHLAHHLIQSYTALIRLLAESQDVPDCVVRDFVIAYRRFAMEQSGIHIPELYNIQQPISQQQFSEWIDQCQEKESYKLARFNPKTLYDTYQGLGYEGIEIDAASFIESVNYLLEAGPDDQLALANMQLQWLRFVPFLIEKTDSLETSIRTFQQLKPTIKELYKFIASLQSKIQP